MNLIIDGLDTKVEVSGGGLVLVMLHGWKDSLETFDELTKELEKDYRIIRIDLPGFGGTQAPKKPWGASQYADFVEKVLLKLEETEIYAFIAHSMGARIAINGLGRRALNSEKLIVIAGAGVPRSPISRNTMSAITKTGKLLTLVLSKKQRNKLREKLYDAYDSDYLGAGELEDTFKKLVAEDARKYARDVHAETLLIYSSNDNITPVDHGEQFAKLIPNARLEVVENRGHNIHKNDPAKTLELIKEFL